MIKTFIAVMVWAWPSFCPVDPQDICREPASSNFVQTSFHFHLLLVGCVSVIRVRSLCLNRWKNTPKLSSFFSKKQKKTKNDSMTDDCLDYKFNSFGFVHMLLQGNSIFFRRDLDRFRPHSKRNIPFSGFTIAT